MLYIYNVCHLLTFGCLLFFTDKEDSKLVGFDCGPGETNCQSVVFIFVLCFFFFFFCLFICLGA